MYSEHTVILPLSEIILITYIWLLFFSEMSQFRPPEQSTNVIAFHYMGAVIFILQNEQYLYWTDWYFVTYTACTQYR